ncbi:MAG: hypothetical protein KJO40_01350 [Deltaproteobacteria bacterium]|nr:hypothetical protein [Deltaproteobacteria bacterium]MBT8466580.1 hypothetical protein [Deltaproteobacteria bacterium]NNK05877.1 hypothetical protein [Myxococcales bacterium]NNK44164.1 hypothetical protein [Myxococcales bacterium]RZV49990.1 MAG: hypothetical protein EX268_18030 [Deltaproteobacteria bacterium]
MRKHVRFILASAIALAMAGAVGCSSDGGGGAAGAGGSGGTAGTGGSGGGGIVANPCQDNGGSGEIEILDEEITEDTLFEAACTYILTQETYVRDAEIEIEPGTMVLGDQGSALIVTTTGRIEAAGTAEDPIVFTSSALPSEAAAGDWGGVVLLGLARLSWGDTPCDGEAGECVGSIEGIAPGNPRGAFGGDDDTHDCGTLRYVRIEYAGFQFGNDNELNSLTVGGCGDQTELSYIQAHRGLDDGVEFFGGTAPIDHMIVTGTGDDGLDWDQGYRGTVDDFIIHHFSSTTTSPNGIEADNQGSGDNNVQPRSAPQLTNGTIIGDGRIEGSGVVTRVGTWGTMNGLVVVGFGGAGYDMRNGAWSLAGGWPDGILVENSCFDGNGENYPVDDNDPKDDSVSGGADFFDEPTLLADAARNNVEADPGLGDFSTAATGGSPAPDYSLSNASCLGAFGGPSGTDWTAGWTAYPEGAAGP